MLCSLYDSLRISGQTHSYCWDDAPFSCLYKNCPQIHYVNRRDSSYILCTLKLILKEKNRCMCGCQIVSGLTLKVEFQGMQNLKHNLLA